MKQLFVKWFAVLLSLAVLINTAHLTLATAAPETTSSVPAEETVVSPGEENVSADTAEESDYEEELFIIGEDTSRRQENEKHFRMSDGSYVATVYPEAVHYSDDGKWEDINNTLTLTEDGYRNTAGSFEVVFGDGSSDELYTITDGEYSVKLTLLRPTDDKTISATSQVKKVTLGVNADDTAKTFDVKSAASAVDEFKAANPDADESEIEAIAAEQREENKRQREYMLRPKNLTSSISYADVLGNVDFEYVVTPTSVKENIILSDADDGNVFGFTLDTELTPRLNDDGSLDLHDGDEIVFSMPAPYMYDAAGRTSYDVAYDIIAVKDQFLLAVEADPIWLSDPARVFPVTIDPTVVSGKTEEDDWNIVTNYMSESDSEYTSHQGEQTWYTGYDPSDGAYVSYLKVRYLPQIPYNCKFNKAELSMYMYPQSTDENYISGFTSHRVSSYYLKLREATEVWSEYEDNDNPIVEYKKISASDAGTMVTFDVTNAAANWYNDSTSNNGLIFTSELATYGDMFDDRYITGVFRGYINSVPETDTNGIVNMPVFCVSYRNYSGVENYHTYQSASAGRAGTFNVSHYTGYMTLARTLVEGTGFTLSYVYNTPYSDLLFTGNDVFNTVDYASMKSHNGWRLNAQQSIVEKELTWYTGGVVSTRTHLIYSDADGTEHYFTETSTPGTYEDEDGLNLTVVKNGNVYTMTDEKDNSKIFRNGYLSEIIDSNGNKVALLYDTENYSETGTAWYPKTSGTQLKKIIYIPDTDKSNLITVATLVYDSTTGYLSSVIDRAEREITFAKTENLLTSITDTDGTVCYYKYDPVVEEGTKRMTFAYDSEACYGIAFEYQNNNCSRIMSYKDFTTTLPYNSATWTVQNIVYANIGDQTSRFRHTGGDKAIATDDDVITTYVFDRLGRTVTARSEDNNGNTIGASGGKYTVNKDTDEKNNKLTKQGGTGAIAQDLLLDSGFEKGTTWNVSRANTGSYGAYVSSNYSHTGTKSYMLRSTAYGGWVGINKTVRLPSAGTYTLSAYVKSTTMHYVAGYDYGVRASFRDVSDNVLSASIKVNKVTPAEIDDGWMKISCSYTVTSATDVVIAFIFGDTYGTVYVDDVQLEKNEAASPFNLLENGNFTDGHSSYWTDSSYAYTDTVEQYNGESGKVLRLSGSPTSVAYATQCVYANNSPMETYILSGWAKAESVPTDDIPEGEEVPTDVRTFGLLATVVYEDETIEHHYADFSYMVFGQWQYVSIPIVPKRTSDKVDHINVSCLYYNNANKAYFDDISLICEAAQSFTYDDEGHIQAVNTTNSDELSSVYEDGNLLSQDGGAAGLYEYSYDPDTHNLIKAVNDGITMDLSYDENGNVVSTTLSDGTDSSDMYMSTSATYTDGGTKVQSTTDNLGNTTENTYYTEENLLSTVTYPLSNSNTDNDSEQTVNYQYNISDRMSVSYITGMVSLNYNYSKGQVASIVRGGYYGSSAKINQTYSFTYNDYGQTTTTKVGDRTLSTNTYDGGTHNLTGITYGNGDSVTYTYDNLERLKTATYNDLGKRVTYYYDYMSNLSKSEVKSTSGTTEYATYHYEYDSLGRLVRCYETLGNDIVQQVECSYDTKNRVSSYDYYDGEEMRDVTYVYDDENGGVLLRYDYGEEGAIGYVYDKLNRVTNKYIRHTAEDGEEWRVDYSYKELNTDGKTSSLVTQINYYDKSEEASFKKLNYTYDNLGNITLITDENGKKLGRYLYDSQNQLVMEEVYPESRSGDPYTMVYKYDTFGNIREAIKYRSTGYDDVEQAYGFGTVLSTETYGYTDSSWSDLLTSYNGTTITYDSMGNPTSYYNGNKTYSMVWENGRQANMMFCDGKYKVFKYNADGIRTQKTVSSSYTENYRLDGDRVVELVRTYNSGSVYRLAFTYDESGNPFSVDCYYGADDTTPTTYYYVLNLQGDVIQLRDENDVVAVNYAYDAWGKILSISNADNANITLATHISNLNPFKYRGYFYDSETGFYYCNTRYYDPQMRRFINADGYVSTGQGYTSYNMFAYCLNNPVMYLDINGFFPWATVGKIGGSIVGMAVTSLLIAASVSTPMGIVAAISITCAAIDGGVSAYIAGGDVSNGILAGTAGGIVSAVITSFFPTSMATNISARVMSSAVYDVTYLETEEGTVTSSDWVDIAADLSMDAMTSNISYGYASNITDDITKAIYYGVSDGIVDITQTGILTDIDRSSKQQTYVTTPIYNNCRSGSGVTTRYNCVM